ncbi:MAG: hypothetical protein AAF623_08335, partial [Planctomycetota bacterium]
FIQGERVAAYLELTDAQISQLENDCRRANKALLQSIIEHQKLVEEKRSELLSILQKLDDKQIEKLSGLVRRPIDEGCFKNADLQFLWELTTPQNASSAKKDP